MSFKSSHTHESFVDRTEVKMGSSRAFGWTFIIAFGLLAGFAKHGRWLFAGLSVLFLVLTLFAPRWLAPLNFIWFKFGLLLSRITNPIVMALLFFAVFLPFSLVFRIFGQKFFSLAPEPGSSTYWIDTSNEIPHSVQRQF